MQTDVTNLLQCILLSDLPRTSGFPQPSVYGKYIPEGVAALLAHPIISTMTRNNPTDISHKILPSKKAIVFATKEMKSISSSQVFSLVLYVTEKYMSPFKTSI